jgi:hypothetical protein
VKAWGEFQIEDEARIPTLLDDYSAYIDDLAQRLKKLRKRVVWTSCISIVVLMTAIWVVCTRLFFHGADNSFRDLAPPSAVSTAILVACLLILGPGFLETIETVKEQGLIHQSLDEGVGKLDNLIRTASQIGAQVDRGAEKFLCSDIALSKAELVLRRARKLL